MFAEKIQAYFTENAQYKNALKTDTFVPCRFYGRRLHGICDDIARFIEAFQLLDTAKWKQFTDLFAEENADGDTGGWKGEYWGKLMRGAAITYRYTRSEKLYAVLEKTILDLLDTQDALGRFSTYAVEKEYYGWDLWARKYVLLGMLHFCEICRDASLKSRIITALKRHLDYIVNTVSDDALPINETSDAWGGANSVSILEPVVLMYNLTGEERYLDFARYIIKTGTKGANIFLLALENEKAPYEWPIRKAYEVISCFEGLLEYYRATGEEQWKTAVLHFAERLIETDVTIIGGCGCEDEFFDHSRATQTDPDNPYTSMQETCVTVTFIKLCDQLLRLTGDSTYADAIERSVYNALYGAVNTEKCTCNHGLAFDSYSPLILRKRASLVGGQQYDSGHRLIYGCCVAIGAAATGLVPEIAAGVSENGLVLHLYSAGEYHLITPQNHPVILWVETAYPQDGKVTVKVDPETEETFEIRLRIPSFSQHSALTVNGKTVPVSEGYTVLKNTWKAGDTIWLDLDMHPRVIHPIGCPGKEKTKDYIAVMYGPLVLARDARMGDSGAPVLLDHAADDRICLERSDTAPFRTLCEFKAPLKTGGSVTLVDYQSAGKTWDERSLTEAWLPTK